jgi:phosphatidylserine/phosphatidylglycerophosphate/cardiolipin synthase-like enzyme
MRQTLLLLLLVVSMRATAGNRIHFYFNHPVNNTVSHGVNAINLNGYLPDTIVAYINRAHYTIDIAVYDYNQGSYTNIATAINNAYSRGVIVRWIYDGSASNTGLSALNPAIYTLPSPTSGSYGIMHNKFAIIDAYSSTPSDAVVITGSFNWSTQQFSTDYNNAVIIQDSALAHAYTDEFNHMWGSTTPVPNTTLSKFGPYKSDLGRHNFIIDGTAVELYFSPSDGTNSHIQTAIASANTDLYFGVYAFTDNSDATMIATKYASGVYVSGINDNFSNSYSPYTTLSTALGSHFIVYTGTGIYHNKYLIVDPNNACSDPMVLTGSHNWSSSANTKNDENTLIIHDDTAANIYYQSFYANFTALGGTLMTPGGCALGTSALTTADNDLQIFPNPTNRDITIKYSLTSPANVVIEIEDMMGRKVQSLSEGIYQPTGEHSVTCGIINQGVYLLKCTLGNSCIIRRVQVN